MVLLEAMAARTPVVATNVGAIPIVLDHGVNGLLVRPGNPQELAGCMQLLLRDRDRARAMADRAYQKVQRLFSSRAMARQYSKVYQGLFQSSDTSMGLTGN